MAAASHVGLGGVVVHSNCCFFCCQVCPNRLALVHFMRQCSIRFSWFCWVQGLRYMRTAAGRLRSCLPTSGALASPGLPPRPWAAA